MPAMPEGNAIVYCEGAFHTTNGKTAHGLVRRTKRYRVLSVIDSRYAGRDAGDILDHQPKGIPVFADVQSAVIAAKEAGKTATHFVIGIAPDGGRLSPTARNDVKKAITFGLNIDSGLHDFLSEDAEIQQLAEKNHVKIRDIRKTPPRSELHFFSSKIEQVDSLRIALLGTDSAVGKRTAAWILVDNLIAAGYSAELVGTGQTAWMQGAKYYLLLDSLINDFVSGEIEHAVWSAWNDHHPDVIIVEGQGSMMNPAYPGGFEILAAARPDAVILQHAPDRKEYDGFPGYPMHPLDQQIRVIELISGKQVVAITINHENLDPEQIASICEQIHQETGLPVCDPLLQDVEPIVKKIAVMINEK